MLRGLGYNDDLINEAEDGEEGLVVAVASEFTPDCILVDISIPRMDGVAFVENYRLTNLLTPTIMICGEGNLERVKEAASPGTGWKLPSALWTRYEKG